jgi:hypothetical protein
MAFARVVGVGLLLVPLGLAPGVRGRAAHAGDRAGLPPAAEFPKVLVGRVVDEQRRPIAGATITLGRAREPLVGGPGDAVTGPDGGFRVPFPPGSEEKNFVVRASRAGPPAELAMAIIYTGRGVPIEFLGTIVLSPSVTRDVVVSGEGAEGAEVEASRGHPTFGHVLARATAGPDGAARLVDLPAGQVHVRVRGRTGAVAEDWMWLVSGAPAAPRRLALAPAVPEPETPAEAAAPPHTSRCAAKAGTAPVPPDGTVLRLERLLPGGADPVATKAYAAGGEVVVEGVRDDLRAWGVAPDGARAKLVDSPYGRGGLPTTFEAARRLDLMVVDESGVPVTGALLTATSGPSGWLVRHAVTDARGGASFEGLMGADADVRMAEGADAFRGIAHALFRGPTTEMRVTVPAAEAYLVRVLIDGKPGLPSLYDLRAHGQDVVPTREDAATGEIRFRARPERRGAPIHLQMEALGCYPVEGDVEGGRVYGGADLQFPAAYRMGKPGEPATFSFRRGGVLRVRARGAFPARSNVKLEREVGGRWEGAYAPGHVVGYGYMDFHRAPVFHVTLDAGRWRVRETQTGATTEPVDVPAAGLVTERDLRAP